MRYVLLLRAVNLGQKNKLPMADLRVLLEELGHGDVKTVLNSGNAVFTADERPVSELAQDVEQGLHQRLGLDVRACVRTTRQVSEALDALPEFPDHDYVVVSTLFDVPAAEKLAQVLVRDWSPERVLGNDQVLYLGYRKGEVHSSKLQNAVLERALGVSSTARTPATLRKLL